MNNYLITIYIIGRQTIHRVFFLQVAQKAVYSRQSYTKLNKFPFHRNMCDAIVKQYFHNSMHMTSLFNRKLLTLR